jgi:hypothetical protein
MNTRTEVLGDTRLKRREQREREELLAEIDAVLAEMDEAILDQHQRGGE